MACWFCRGSADVLTAGEIAERLETQPKLVQRWIYTGELEADSVTVGPGTSWRVSGDRFWRFLDRHPAWLVRLAGGDPRVARKVADRLRPRRRPAALVLPKAA
jgi:hypothetical protein